MTAGDVPVAAFDVDGTLTTVDTFIRFLGRVADLRSYAMAAGALPLAVAVATRRAERDQLKARIVNAVFRGRCATDVDAEGREHAERIRTRWLRADTVARLRWHQGEGHRTVLVSASLRAYLDPLGAWLGVDDVICTDLGVGRDGRLDGRLDGGNCRGAAKAERLLAHLGRRPSELWAYGDSDGDRELLALADHASHVGGRNPIAAAPTTTVRRR